MPPNVTPVTKESEGDEWTGEDGGEEEKDEEQRKEEKAYEEEGKEGKNFFRLVEESLQGSKKLQGDRGSGSAFFLRAGSVSMVLRR